MEVALMASIQISCLGTAIAPKHIQSADFRLKKAGENGSTSLPLYDMAMRLESLKGSSKFTYGWITRTENEFDQQKAAT